MPEDETIQNDVADDVTDDQTEVVESGEQQTQVDPYAFPDNLKSRYKSAEELANFAATKQSEADTTRREFEEYKRQHPAPQSQPPKPTPDEVLEKLARDPVGFVNEQISSAVAPIAAQVGLNAYADSGHPEIKNPEFKRAMETVINENPALVNDPDGLDFAYFKVKNQVDAAKKAHADSIIQTHNAGVQQTKQTTAVVEGATAPQPKASPKIVPGMSQEEQDKILDSQGVGWISDEEREYD